MIKEFKNNAAVLAGLERVLNRSFGPIFGLVEITEMDTANNVVKSVSIQRLTRDVFNSISPRVGNEIVVLNVDNLLDLSDELYMNVADLGEMLQTLEAHAVG